MDKYIKWFFVLLFLVTSVLFGFGVLEATNVGVATLYLCLAYIALKADIKVKK